MLLQRHYVPNVLCILCGCMFWNWMKTVQSNTKRYYVLNEMRGNNTMEEKRLAFYSCLGLECMIAHYS